MDKKQAASEWIRVCNITEIPDDMGFKLQIENDYAIAAFRVGQEYFVVEDKCTHGAASLSEGFIEGFEIECPFHGGKFDLRSGKPTAFPCTLSIQTHEVRIEENALYALIYLDKIQPENNDR
ncbi:MAG: hypothetical protein CMN56_01485 [Sneathiella sp.]|mgnify:CR=1 FL=1|uniref:non-heme iron oxygenase ferredoxin subunit n=1 Tax=Sneathiella sp. TaxID=1964365 RepID=UPI000C3C6045|nr:non-heme iron oxygenase ferredoxin subunit [Sneathiella sp.]MAZ01788.1 hypothetical protein [Sneathiella sp.]|tara:strand:+ start:659 stop:1024 length:366 start_codon:yes stop_codon:yes gene_type:complete